MTRRVAKANPPKWSTFLRIIVARAKKSIALVTVATVKNIEYKQSDQNNICLLNLSRLIPFDWFNSCPNLIDNNLIMSNIARRTRSHISIDDNILNTDNLDFPDVDENLYQNPGSNSDPIYRDFLNQIYSEEVGQGTDTNTEDNDPPYVLNNDIFSPGWRYDVREGLAQEQLDQMRHDQYQNLQLQMQQQQVISELMPVASMQAVKEEIFGQEFTRVLNQQLRQHIQLLTQTCLLARSMKNTQKEAEEAKEHLNSYIEIFNHRRKPSNLLPAIQLVHDFGTPKELKSSIRLSWRHLPVPDSVKQIIERNANVFPYEDLLPRVAFSRLPDKLVTKRPKSEFTLNEDKLLALALDEFKGETAQYAYIASLLLPAKTRKQIADHIKNIKRNKVGKEPGSEDNPIRLYLSSGKLPHVDLGSDDHSPETMNMDDLMAASTTISKHNKISEKNIKSSKLRKSIMDLMCHKASISDEMGNVIVHEFLKASQEKLTERNYLHLLQLLTDLMRKEAKKDNSLQRNVKIYKEISKYLKKIEAPNELHERLVLLLNLETATECDCAFSYLHWMRIIQFVQHAELYHEGEGVEKKLSRLIDSIQKGDSHKVKLAAANLINKHPLLKREYEALKLDGKPHPSLFINEEDFDDQTEPFLIHDDSKHFEHFEHKLTQDEMNYASQSCPCKCHQKSSQQQEEQQHCGKCNLKLMKGRMYLVNKKKPCLAEWTYIDRQPPRQPAVAPPAPATPPPVEEAKAGPTEWTFEEDKEILEFCQAKSLQHDESASFDTSTFEELVKKRADQGSASYRSAPEIAERFNHLYKRMMEMYKRDE